MKLRTRNKGLLASLIGVKQETLDSWTQKLEDLITVREEAEKDYQFAADKIIPLLRRAKEKNIPSRAVALITGISHTTICHWMKLLDSEANGNA